MILVAGLAIALLLLAMAGMGQGSTSEQIVARLASEKDPRIVAAAAQVLEGRGMKLTAEALRARARDLSSRGATAGVSGTTPESASPPTVASETWSRFEQALTCGPAGSRTPSGRLGMFLIHLRRLAELGYVRQVHRTVEGTLAAQWIDPVGEAGFLADPALQRRVLLESTAGLTEAIARRHPFAVGQIVGERRASLSGLLAVAHRVGIGGLEAWLASAPERARQRIATTLFQRANGIF